MPMDAAIECKDAAIGCKDAAIGCKDAAIECKDAAIGCKDAAIGSQESEVVDPTLTEERLAAKRAEEKMAGGCHGELFVAKRPRLARQIVLKEAPVAEEVKPTAKQAGDAKKPKMGRVPQAYIDMLLARPRVTVRPLSDELINKMTDLELREEIRAVFGGAFARVQAAQAKDDDILKQYHLNGYAEEEITDDEEEM